MRVHKLRDRGAGEQGAVAVTVALLSTVLIGVAAFTVDFGAAYVAKRDTANATEAASLAGAREMVSTSGSCATVAANATAVTAARNSADTYLSDNVNSATRTAFSVACDSTGKSVEVRYGADATIERALGGVFGGSGKYTVNREATAAVGVASVVKGLRPYMVCFSDVATLELGGVRQINYPSATCGAAGGNWYSVDCPGDGNNGTAQTLATNTELGCDQEIGIIPTKSTDSDATKISTLQSKCPQLQADPGCLTSNPGNLASNNIEDAWIKLLGKEILLPVFFPNSIIGGNGNNTRYPVYAFVGVTVCGYHWQNKPGASTAGVCAGTSWAGGNYDALKLVLTNVITSGTTKQSTCSLGDTTCDFGARTLRLVK